MVHLSFPQLELSSLALPHGCRGTVINVGHYLILNTDHEQNTMVGAVRDAARSCLPCPKELSLMVKRSTRRRVWAQGPQVLEWRHPQGTQMTLRSGEVQWTGTCEGDCEVNRFQARPFTRCSWQLIWRHGFSPWGSPDLLWGVSSSVSSLESRYKQGLAVFAYQDSYISWVLGWSVYLCECERILLCDKLKSEI